MEAESFLKCSCHNCGGHIEFPPDASGQSVECPHCGWETELRVERKPASRATKRKTLLVAMLVSLVLIGALIAGILVARKNSPAPPASQTPQLSPTSVAKIQPEEPVKHRRKRGKSKPTARKSGAIKDFEPGEITIENSGGRLIYAVGTLHNETARQRFGVKVQLNLFNANGKKIGAASDYAQVIEPNGEWHFRALVTDPKTTRAEIASIEED